MDHQNAASHVRAHTAAAIQERLHAGPQHSYLRDFIYGSIDGAVTTFAVVSGVAGASLSSTIVIILGMANLVGDGFSMATSNYLATRADRERIDRVRKMEHEHIDTYPEGEREEIRQIFAQKGFTGADLEGIVTVITADRERWVDTMIREEYGLTLEERSPLKAAGVTFLAFVLLGAVPLTPFVYEYLFKASTTHAYQISTLLTVSSFFIVGAVKARFVDRKWYSAGLTTLMAGSAAAILAYLVGLLLRGLAG